MVSQHLYCTMVHREGTTSHQAHNLIGVFYIDAMFYRPTLFCSPLHYNTQQQCVDDPMWIRVSHNRRTCFRAVRFGNLYRPP